MIREMSLDDFTMLPNADGPDIDHPDLDESTLAQHQFGQAQIGAGFYRRNGYLILRDFLPHEAIGNYVRLWESEPEAPWAVHSPVAFVIKPEIRDLCLWPPLVDVLNSLIGGEMVLKLTLCGWKSTERTWHQDTYLNPPETGDWYIAAWMALDEIHADSGPFEFVPGSHRWPAMIREKVLAQLAPEERDHHWPRRAERFVTDVFDREICARGAVVRQFLPASKGDVLLWHPRLVHRGGVPRNRSLQRRALIAHYVAMGHTAPEHPPIAKHGEHGWYFDFPYREH